MDQAERIDRMEKGQEASVALGFLDGPLDEYRNVLVTRLIANYRAGQTHHDTILGGVAELAALDNLKKYFENIVTRGNAAAQQELK